MCAMLRNYDIILWLRRWFRMTRRDYFLFHICQLRLTQFPQVFPDQPIGCHICAKCMSHRLSSLRNRSQIAVGFAARVDFGQVFIQGFPAATDSQHDIATEHADKYVLRSDFIHSLLQGGSFHWEFCLTPTLAGYFFDLNENWSLTQCTYIRIL